MTMPVPVSPPLPVRTSIDTTLGRIFAATVATELSDRATTGAVLAVVPSVTVFGADPLSSAACTTSPPTVPANTAAMPAVRATTGHVIAGAGVWAGCSGGQVT